MRKTLKYILLFSFFVCSSNSINAQLCEQCDISCIICEDLDGFTGNNGSTSAGSGPASFCTIVQHQMLWLGFVASSEDLSIEVEVSACTAGNLEVGLYEAIDCNDPTLISNCFGGSNGNTIGPGQSGVVTANQSLTIGQYYFLVFDMTSDIPNNCDFNLSVINGETGASDIDEQAVLTGPDVLCDGEEHVFVPEVIDQASNYTWTINGEEQDEGLELNFSEEDLGSYTICATPFNYCSVGLEGCFTLNVGESYEEYYLIQACYENCAEFEGQLYCNDGVRDFEYITELGCDSIIIIEIEWYNSDDEIYIGEFSICDGETFEYENYDFNEAGTYHLTLEDSHECDSFVEFDLIIIDTIKSFSQQTICANEIFIWNQDTLSTSGFYSSFLTSIDGCDSSSQLQLIVLDQFETNIDEQFCNFQTVAIGDTLITEEGIHIINLLSTNGCDSIVTLNLTITDSIFVSYFESICEGDSLSFGGTWYNTEGTFQQNHITFDGCDSIETLQLTINNRPTTELFETICAGEVFNYQLQQFNTSGSYQFELSDINNCDSLITVHLSVLDSLKSELTINLCQGDSLNYLGTLYTGNGIHNLITNSFNGCDSFITLRLEYFDSYIFEFDNSICEGDSVLFDNSFQHNEGIYSELLSSSFGCDSTTILNLTVLENSEINLNVEICNGELYPFGNDQLDKTGNYTISELNINGCDSIVTLDLLVNEVYFTELENIICNNDSVYFNDEFLSTPGIYNQVLQSTRSCDSLIQLNLIVQEEIINNQFITLCEFESFNFEGDLISTSGLYSTTYITDTGCDSIINLNAIFEDCSIQFNSLVENVTCNDLDDGLIELFEIVGIYPIEYNLINIDNTLTLVSGTLDQFQESLVIEFLSAGFYNIEIIDGLGEIINYEFEITEPDPLELISMISDFNGFNTSCFGVANGDVSISVTGGTKPYYEAKWSDGYIGNTRDSIAIGTYSVTIEDKNGCVTDLEFDLLQPDELRIDYELEIIDPCDSNLSILFANTSGGSGMLIYGVENFDGNPIAVDNIPEGEFILFLTDENGCRTEQIIAVPEFTPLELDLGADLEINFGQNINIEPEVNFEVQQYSWSTIPVTNICTTCEVLQLSASDNLLVILEAINNDNCSVRDTIELKVISPLKIYLPNVISSKNGINSIFNIAHNVELTIQEFKIYSRWGELIYDNVNINTNSISDGWDGTYNDKKMDSGVFVYRISFTDINGISETIIGTVTLLN